MAATLERTFTLDRDLTRRAERKLRRYGRTLDDAFAYIISVVVSTRGEPQFVRKQESDPFFQEPNASHLRRAIADMNAGRNIVEHDLIEFSVNGITMRPRRSARISPIFGSENGLLTARLDKIGLDAFAATRKELADEVRSQLAMLWKEYALADDAELTESARKVKRNLLASFEEA